MFTQQKIQNLKKDALPKSQRLIIFYSEEGDVSHLNFKAFSNKFFLYVSGIWLVIYRNLSYVFFNMPHLSTYQFDEMDVLNTFINHNFEIPVRAYKIMVYESI